VTKKGRVIQSTGSWYEVAIEESEGDSVIKSRLPGRFRLEDHKMTNPVVVGDFVEISLNSDGTGTIEEIKERENYITRKATHGRQGEQLLASNLDQAIVMQSVRKPKIKEGFINRFLVMCEAYELNPLIVINKMDLADEKANRYVQDLKKLYTGLNYPLITTGIYDEQSLEKFKSLLKNRTSAVIGPSGVGKTSVLNHLDPNINRPTGEVSSYSDKGIHTTTYARLVSLHFGGYLVDTPGIREFGLINIAPWELSLFFPEMLEPRKNCKFNNCTHSHEPDCGVVEAFKQGSIDAERYKSYLNMLESLEKDN